MSDAKEPRIWAIRDRAMPAPVSRQRAERMRAEPTRAEAKLWRALRSHVSLTGTHFRRQVRLRTYIVDFASHRAKLIIEVDGGQHADSQADALRTKFLTREGYRVLRFWNNDVLTNIEGVMAEIARAITTPTPDPSPQGGGERRPRAPLTRHS